MKRMNEERFSDTGKEHFKGFTALFGIGFLAVFLVGMLTAGVPNATAATAATADTVNITTGISMVDNTSVVWILVDGEVQKRWCINNLCSVPRECEDCPECLSINFTELEGNLTTKMDALEAMVRGHNSSALEEEDREFIDVKVSEGASYSASQIWEYLNQTILPSKRELEDKDELIISLKDSLREMNNTINLQGEELRNYETTTSELNFSRNFAFIIVAIFFLLVIFMYASKQGTLGDYKGRIKEGFGGLMPEQKRMRKLQEIEEGNAALEEEIKIDDALERQEELKRKRSLIPRGEGSGMNEDPLLSKDDDVDEEVEAPTPFSPQPAASAAVVNATKSGGVNLAKKRKERVTAIIGFIEGKEDCAHSEAEILRWYADKFGKSENTAKLEWGLARNMIEETYLGEMHFIGTPKGGLRFAKNG